METLLVLLFVFTSIVSSIAYIIELHIRINRENELDELTHLTTTQFTEWKRKRKEKMNEQKSLQKNQHD